MIDQLRPSRRFARIGGAHVEVDVNAQVQRRRVVCHNRLRAHLDVDFAGPIDRAFLDKSDLANFLGTETASHRRFVEHRRGVGLGQRFDARHG